MAYDKLSFLSGVAAGRNMESWPAFEPVNTGHFSFVIDTSLGGSTEYSFRVGRLSPIIISWGDGTTSTITQGSGSPSHTYDNHGVYLIVVIGYVTGVSFNAGSTAAEKMAAESLILVETPIEADPNASGQGKLISFESMFKGCINLVEVPDSMLTSFYDNGYHIYSTKSMFEECRSLRRIPSDLFSGCIFDEDMHIHDPVIDRMFYNCKSLKSISPRVFGSEFSKIKSVDSLFRGSGLRTVPTGVFSSFDHCGDFTSCFANCEQLRDTGSSLFQGNPYPTSFGAMFKNCPNLSSIGDNLFNQQNSGYFEQTFAFCESLEVIPPDLFRFDWAIGTYRYVFGGTFYGDTQIGSLVPELWLYYDNWSGDISNVCYRDCENAINYSDIPERWK